MAVSVAAVWGRLRVVFLCDCRIPKVDKDSQHHLEGFPLALHTISEPQKRLPGARGGFFGVSASCRAVSRCQTWSGCLAPRLKRFRTRMTRLNTLYSFVRGHGVTGRVK